jgi:hypothetical protein
MSDSLLQRNIKVADSASVYQPSVMRPSDSGIVRLAVAP